MPLNIYDINRKHNVNQTYFDVIDDEHKAYWLGLLWADGCISKTAKRCSGKNRLQISQSQKHDYLITQFRRDIQADYDIIHDNTPTQYHQQPQMVSLTINSRPLCQALENLGFDTKDKRISIPPIQNELMPHFIRGYFDGDGCISVYQQNVKNRWKINRHELSFTGYPAFIKNLQKYLEDNTAVTKGMKLKHYKNTTNAVSLRYGGLSSINTLTDYMYESATVFAKDKYQKLINICSQ